MSDRALAGAFRLHVVAPAHGRVVIDLLGAAGRYTVAGVLDRPDGATKSLVEYPVLGCDIDRGRLMVQPPKRPER